MTEETKELAPQETSEMTKSKPEYRLKEYLPAADLIETREDLLLYLDMPGVEKDDVEILLENNTLTVKGKIRPDAYAKLTPLFTEYRLGHYARKFELSDKIDRSRIEAKMEAGVLTLVLPKAAEMRPRSITVKAA